MAKAKKQLSEYIVMPAFNEAAIDNIRSSRPGITREELINAMNTMEKQQLSDLRGPVTEIVKKEGGEVLIDGSGFAVKDHPQQYASFMLVKVTPETADKIAKQTGASVGPNRTFHTC
jgi:hypothetical protein